MEGERLEVRCPTDNKLMVGLSDGFVGAISVPCRRCKTVLQHPASASIEQRRILCHCGKWLATGKVLGGTACLYCKRCRALSFITTAGAQKPRYDPPPVDQLVALVEDRWKLLRYDRSRRSVEIAVGIRFDVFNRDGFRCRYCGRGPDQGVYLEADHVIPRSADGPDTMANLVTACWDCNRGKSAKPLLAS